MASTWGTNTWGANAWASDVITASLTGQSITSNVGSLEAFNKEGWGRQEYGNSAWGVQYSVAPSGLSITSSVGTATAAQFITAELTGVSTTLSVGEITPADVIGVSGQSITSAIGELLVGVEMVGVKNHMVIQLIK